jgi:hypothetical protein
LVTKLDGGKRKGYMLDTIREPVRLVSRFIKEIDAGENKVLPQKAENLKTSNYR